MWCVVVPIALIFRQVTITAEAAEILVVWASVVKMVFVSPSRRLVQAMRIVQQTKFVRQVSASPQHPLARAMRIVPQVEFAALVSASSQRLCVRLDKIRLATTNPKCPLWREDACKMAPANAALAMKRSKAVENAASRPVQEGQMSCGVARIVWIYRKIKIIAALVERFVAMGEFVWRGNAVAT
jgi:hypothetical protein